MLFLAYTYRIRLIKKVKKNRNPNDPFGVKNVIKLLFMKLLFKRLLKKNKLFGSQGVQTCNVEVL